MEDDFLSAIVSLHKENKWKEILKFNCNSESNATTRKLSWIWPSIDNLCFIKNLIELHGLRGVISIGCGSGLFEWLLQQCTEIPVIGYEVNKEWWCSKYCTPQFIPLVFPEMPPKSECLYKDHALLFCYFNNGMAFDDYVKAYVGNLIFIIGPGKGRGTHTNPDPFKPNLQSPWYLADFVEIKNTKDFLAAYVRDR